MYHKIEMSVNTGQADVIVELAVSIDEQGLHYQIESMKNEDGFVVDGERLFSTVCKDLDDRHDEMMEMIIGGENGNKET